MWLAGWDDVALCSAYRRGLSEEIKDLLVRDRPTSRNDLAYLAHQMDERLRERRLERAQQSMSAARMPSVRTGTNPGRSQGPTATPFISSAGASMNRSGEEEEPMQLGRSRLSPETREPKQGPSELNGYSFTLPHHKQPVSSLPCQGPGNPYGWGTLGFGG